MQYAIQSVSEMGWWSNKDGWVFSVNDAAIFTEEQTQIFAFLPQTKGRDARWITTDFRD